MIRKLLTIVGITVLLTGTGVQSAAASTGLRGLHFRSPQGAMRYLARAYDRHDDVALRHVTNPAAREQLAQMRGFATNLELSTCAGEPSGMYACTFSHDFLATQDAPARPGGWAVLRVAPATRPGWVAKGDIDCD